MSNKSDYTDYSRNPAIKFFKSSPLVNARLRRLLGILGASTWGTPLMHKLFLFPKMFGQYLDIRVQSPFSDVEGKKDGEHNKREEEGN